MPVAVAIRRSTVATLAVAVRIMPVPVVVLLPSSRSGLCGTVAMTVTAVVAAAGVSCMLAVGARTVRMPMHNPVPASSAVGGPLNAANRQKPREERGANQLARESHLSWVCD